MKHKKHTSLVRPKLGNRVRNELAFVGANCSLIQETISTILPRLSDMYTIAYVDADHAYFDQADENRYLENGAKSFMDFSG